MKIVNTDELIAREELLQETGLDIDKMSDKQKIEWIKKKNEDVEKLEKTRKKWVNVVMIAFGIVLLYAMIT